MLLTRWSSTITQSETYSSRPWRVSASGSLPRSPVTTAVTPLALSQPNRRRSSARRISSLGRAENSDSMVSSTTPPGLPHLPSGSTNSSGS